MMKHIFPALVLLSIGGIIVFAGSSASALWALAPLALSVSIVAVSATIFFIKGKGQTVQA